MKTGDDKKVVGLIDNEYGGFNYISAGVIKKSKLEQACSVEAEVMKICSIADNTISVKYGGDVYDDVPCYIHSDYGTRAREYVGVKPTSPEELFERAVMHFPFSEFNDNGPITFVKPKVMALLIPPDEENNKKGEMLCAYQVLQSLDNAKTDLITTLPRTWYPYIVVQFNAIGDPDVSNITVTGDLAIVIDLITMKIATLPNKDGDSLIDGHYVMKDTNGDIDTEWDFFINYDIIDEHVFSTGGEIEKWAFTAAHLNDGVEYYREWRPWWREQTQIDGQYAYLTDTAKAWNWANVGFHLDGDGYPDDPLWTDNQHDYTAIKDLMDYYGCHTPSGDDVAVSRCDFSVAVPESYEFFIQNSTNGVVECQFAGGNFKNFLLSRSSQYDTGVHTFPTDWDAVYNVKEIGTITPATSLKSSLTGHEYSINIFSYIYKKFTGGNVDIVADKFFELTLNIDGDVIDDHFNSFNYRIRPIANNWHEYRGNTIYSANFGQAYPNAVGLMHNIDIEQLSLVYICESLKLYKDSSGVVTDSDYTLLEKTPTCILNIKNSSERDYDKFGYFRVNHTVEELDELSSKIKDIILNFIGNNVDVDYVNPADAIEIYNQSYLTSIPTKVCVFTSSANTEQTFNLTVKQVYKSYDIKHLSLYHSAQQ